MTPNEVVEQVRDIIQDTVATYRYSDAMLVRYVNQVVRRIAMLRPDLFVKRGTFTVVSNVSQQSLTISGAARLAKIIRVDNGSAIEEVDFDHFTRADKDWMQNTAGIPTKYMRIPQNPLGFYLYPRPSSALSLLVEYVASPTIVAASSQLDLPDIYFGTVVDGVVFLVESMDDESVNSQRAKLFYDSFVGSLGTSLRLNSYVDAGRAITNE
jgi:hypothetical protein